MPTNTRENIKSRNNKRLWIERKNEKINHDSLRKKAINIEKYLPTDLIIIYNKLSYHPCFKS